MVSVPSMVKALVDIDLVIMAGMVTIARSVAEHPIATGEATLIVAVQPSATLATNPAMVGMTVATMTMATAITRGAIVTQKGSRNVIRGHREVQGRMFSPQRWSGTTAREKVRARASVAVVLPPAFTLLPYSRLLTLPSHVL